jgi:hemoglobin/transferrin/lactoferrin receptor protein
MLMKQPTLRLLRSLILAAWPCAALAAPLDLDLPQQPLQLSLQQLAQRAGLTLQAPPLPVLRQSAPALRGRLEVDAALRELLQGTGLQASIADGALRLEAAVPAAGQRLTIVGQRLGVDVGERVRRGQASDVRDLFATEASADIGGGTRNGQRLYLRGIEASQLNVTIDGARQGTNLYNHRGGLSNIDPEVLQRVEINSGPPAADDGYGALGGSVRFQTADAQSRLADGQRLGGMAKAQVGTVNDARRGALGAWGLVADSVGLLAYATGTEFDDLHIGGGDRVPFSGGRDRTLLLKLSALQVGAHSLRLGFEDNEASGFNFMQRGDYPYQVQPPITTRPPQDQTLRRTASTLRWDYDPGSPWLRLRLQVADSKSDFYAPNSNAERFTSRVRNADLRNELAHEVGGVALRTTLGLDRFEERGSSEFLNRATTFTGTENTGLYLQSRLAGERWTAEAGVRHDRWDTDFSARSASGDATSGNLQGSLELGAGVTLFGGVGESARGYSTIPLQFTRNIASTLTLNGTANGTLRSETARLSQLGARWQGRSLLAEGDRVQLELKAYDNRIRDAILYRQPGSGGLGGRPVTDFYNDTREVRFHGLELAAGWSAGAHTSSLSLARPQVANLPPDPQFIARYGAPSGGKLVFDHRWQALPTLTLGYTLTAVRRLDGVPTDQVVFIPRAGYVLHDLQLVWQPQELWPGASLALAVNNASDRRYSNQVTFSERGFATEEAGRNVRLTLGMAF